MASQHGDGEDAIAEITRQLREIRATMSTIGSKTLELERRVMRTEQHQAQATELARKALDSHDELEGSLMAEVGSLAKGHHGLGAQLQSLQNATTRQDAVLAEQTKDLKAIKAERDFVAASVTTVKWLAVAAPGLWMAIQWAIAHVRL